MIQGWGWNQTSTRIAPQSKSRKELESRIKAMNGYTPVLVNGKPMEIKEEVSLHGDIYYVIVLDLKAKIKKTPTE